MYKKSAIKKIGSIVVVAALIASAFTMISVGETEPVSSDTVTINEIMYDPASGNDEWVELYNPGDSEVNVSGWTLMDEGNQTFGNLTDVVIPAGGYHVVTDAAAILNNDGDTVTLYDGETVVDTVTYPGDGTQNHSLEYNSGTPAWHESRVEGGTPGARNSVLWPEATIEYPTGGEVIGGMIPIQWNASSPAGLNLAIDLHYKNDSATTWKEITTNEENDGLYRWDATGLATTDQYMVKVTAADTMSDTWHDASEAFNSTTMSATPLTTPFNSTKDVSVDGTSGTVKLYNTDGSMVDHQDGSPGDVIFYGVTFDDTGTWWVNDTNEGTFYLQVTPIDLNVTARPAEVEFAKSGSAGYVEVNGTVSNPDGTAASGAHVEIWAPGVTPSSATDPIKTVTTNTTGHYAFTTRIRISLHGAGIYNVTARKGPIGDANAFGYAHMTVTEDDANVSLDSMKDVSGGFSTGEIAFSVTGPDGDRLLPNQDYNLSVWKGNTLYSWHNTTGTTGGNMTFETYGKLLNISTKDIWEQGDYTLKVHVDYAGNSDWEYTGEGDFTIPAPAPVNVYVTQDSIDVLSPEENAQNITIQVLGNTRYTYGNRSNLHVEADNKNITKRISIEGHVLYTPKKEAYAYLGNGTWNVTVFPTMGGGMIYINVSWPRNDTVTKNVTIDKGGMATISPTSVIVDDPTNLTAVVTYNNNNVFNANVTLYYEEGIYGLGNMVTNGTIDGDYTPGKGSGGEYIFDNIVSKQANTNIIVRVKFTSGTQDVYAYANIRSEAAHDLNVNVTPNEALLGEQTTFEFNVTRDGDAYGDTNLEFYLMNQTELDKFHDDYTELPATREITPTMDSTGNFTYEGHIDMPGTWHLYVRTDNEKHDNLDNETSIQVTKATVTADPSMLVKNVDVNKTVVFTVERNNEAVNGTLHVTGIQEVGSYEAFVNHTIDVEIVNGEGNITNVTATEIGNVTFKFTPAASGSVEGEADGTLEVVTPTIDVSPEKVHLGEQNVITLTVKHPLTNNPVPGLTVSGKFPAGNMTLGKTDSNGEIVIGIIPDMTGTITLFVEGDKAGEITIDVGGLKIHVIGERYFYVLPELEKGKEYTIKVTTKGDKEIQGATVEVAGNTYTTNADGEVTWKPDKTGDFTITATIGTYEDGSRDVKVKEGPSTPGFGFAALVIGVLGAALILWRRRH